MGKAFFKHITKSIWIVLIFIMVVTMSSCSTSPNKEDTGVVPTTVPTESPSPPPKTLEFSIDRDRIDFVVIYITSNNSDNGFHGNSARIYDKEGIDATIQVLNSMEVYPKDESYKYYGGDSPSAMVNFFDKQSEPIELINICFDQKLNEIVLRYNENIYQISSNEIDKLYEICELYNNDKKKKAN